MIATLKAEEQGQLQLVEREEFDDEEDLFEAIDKSIEVINARKGGPRTTPNELCKSSVAIALIKQQKPNQVISQGINSGDVKKLQDAGIYTCNGLMMLTKKHLTEIKGLSEAKVDRNCEAAEKIVVCTRII
ncbi:hypothetical protein Tsubulata_019580 [Turnera subulata]|uniref:DNA recombination and repair protein Rad51-like C-terminal domain-containing protein n=1 Tax=Turnera subulata TaxID=218843 RepID=A0A9Q0FBR8_9ROSI|nr:hypothetical protein Tsubulata_019580 [Turnera subulata]